MPKSFGVIFDGWSCDGEHYIGIFGTWVNISGGVVERLLSCGVQDIPDDDDAEDFGFTAADIGDYFHDVLVTRYKKSWEVIEFVCGDNASVNRLLATLIEQELEKTNISRNVPLIGCVNHKLNLGVQSLYAEDTDYYEVVNKVQALMVNLSTIKNRPKLATKTSLSPLKRNETRWGSVFVMLKRYVDLQPILPTCPFCPETKLKFLTTHETYLVTALLEILYKCERASIFLQTNDAHKVNLLSARVLFDQLITDIPELEHYLAADADIVHCPAFENAVVKLQRGQALSAADKIQLAIFKQPLIIAEETAGENLTFEQGLLRSVEATKRAAARGSLAEFRSTFHVSPTSNIVERLFSRAGLIMRPNRRQMDPSTLEMLLMLRLNKDMWGEKTVQDIIDNKKAAARERKRAQDAARELEKETDDA